MEASTGVLRADVRAVVEQAPGPELVAGLLTLMETGDLTARELLEVSVAWQKTISFAQAAQLTAVAALDRAVQPDAAGPALRGGSELPAGRRAADELAPALRVAAQTASRLVTLSRRLDGDLPATLDALADGRMDLAHVRVVEDVTRDLTPAVAGKVEALAVAEAPGRTPAQLAPVIATEAQRLDRDHAARAADRGRTERDVALRPSPLHGCRRLTLDLPTETATAAWHAVNGAATTARDQATGDSAVRPDGTREDRLLPQLRADIAAARLTGTDDPHNPAIVPTPETLARLAEVHVVVAADTLLAGGDDANGTGDGTCDDGSGTGGGGRSVVRGHDRADLPAQIPGVAPLDTARARDIARHTRWRRAVVHPSTGVLLALDERTHPASRDDGELGADDRLWRVLTDPLPATVLDHGTSRYVPPAALRRHVHTRDAGCVGPACHHTARGTQLDHTTDYGTTVDGHIGTTSDENLGPLCQRSHNAKTHGGWRLAQTSPGAFTWTSPLGRVYHRRARPLLPGWAHDHDGVDQPP